MLELVLFMWFYYENFFRFFVFDFDVCCIFEINCFKEKWRKEKKGY